MRPEIRRCPACHCLHHRDVLFRIQIRANKLYKASMKEAKGRSLYICRNHACLDTILKRRLLQKCWKQLTATEVNRLITDLKNELDRYPF